MSNQDKPLSLDQIRKDISQLDNDLLALLNQRRHLSHQVAVNKKQSEKELRDQSREKQLLESLIAKAAKQGLDSHYVTNLFNLIIEDSVKLQKDFLQAEKNFPSQSESKLNISPIVAILGGKGSYSYIAAKRFFTNQLAQLEEPANQSLNSIDCNSFASIIDSVEQGKADYGVIPIENTTSGGITAVYDLLLSSNLSIVGEHKQPIRHCLVAVEGCEVDAITNIAAHPEAALQCNNTLRKKTSAQINQVESTTHAIQKVITEQSKNWAAIASEESAHTFGLKVILTDIADQNENMTRFLVLAKQPVLVSPAVKSKVSIVLSTNQQPGALADILTLFKNANIPLTKLESRPIPNKPWQQIFYIDFEANTANESVTKCLQSLSKNCVFNRLLGCYPAQDTDITQVSTKSLADAKLNRLKKSVSTTHPNEKAINHKEPAQTASSKSYLLASRLHKKENTLITVKNHVIGGEQFTTIAGPCAVESRQQIEACAKQARESGASILRAGCFKPRTSPYSFQGLGFEGLDLLADASKLHNMPVITEVLTPESVEEMAIKADILQIGTRNMQNYPLLTAVGQINCPIMLKRGQMSTIDEWLNAAEYILKQGNQQVFLCERGIRTFETSTRNTLDLSAIPVLKELTHLPIIVDPSHALGRRELVLPMAKAAKAAGADGIMVEFHPDPENALSDGRQSLDFAGFTGLMSELYLK